MSGLTNQQNWDTYGIAIAGAVARAMRRRGRESLGWWLDCRHSSILSDERGAIVVSGCSGQIRGSDGRLRPRAAGSSRVIPFQETYRPAA